MSSNSSAGTRLRSAIALATPRLLALTSEATARPRAEGAWSPREILGHLVDSALVNQQRFLRAADQDDLVFPGYPQDSWVARQRYAEREWTTLVALWRGLNEHVAHTMELAPRELRELQRARHSLDRIAFRTVAADVPSTLDYLMIDYVDHLEHHLRQILGDGWNAEAT